MGTTAEKLAYLQKTKELFIDALSDLLTGFIVFDASKETLRNLATKYVLRSNRSDIPSTGFSSCSGIISVIIPDSITNIGRDAFYNCSSLTSVVIGNSVTSIGRSAFYYCPSMTSVIIGNSVTNIGEYAFSECTGLTSITLNALIPPFIRSSTFAETNNCPIYVPAESVDAYKSATNWSEYADRIQAIPQE